MHRRAPIVYLILSLALSSVVGGLALFFLFSEASLSLPLQRPEDPACRRRAEDLWKEPWMDPRLVRKTDYGLELTAPLRDRRATRLRALLFRNAKKFCLTLRRFSTYIALEGPRVGVLVLGP